MLDANQWTEKQIELHSLDPRQFADFRAATLANGSRIVDAYNASGLSFTILPDRGLDIWSAHYKGIPLTWIAPGSPYPPDFGLGWIEQFNGGLMTTCGLRHAGGPETDDLTGEQRDLHGRYSRLRAADVAVTRSSEMLTLHGTVSEHRLFGEQLRLQRTYTLFQREPALHINDVITNLNDVPAPLMLLYHINVGFPLVSAGAELQTPYQAVYARNDEARKGLDRWPAYDAPVANREEQVYFHHVKADGRQHTQVLLQNGSFGFQVAWDAAALPYFTQWKNTRQGMYVSGIEPGNCIPEGQNSARKSGRLQILAPGDEISTSLHLSILDGADAVAQAVAQIKELQANGTPTGADFSDFS